MALSAKGQFDPARIPPYGFDSIPQPNHEAAVSPSLDPTPDAAEQPAPENERRAAPRHRLVRRCLAWPEGSNAAAEPWHCIAYDVSTNGIGLAVPLPPRVGTFLTIEADGLPRPRQLRVRVAHVRAVAYVWFCGCELETALNEEELSAWLSRPRS